MNKTSLADLPSDSQGPLPNRYTMVPLFFPCPGDHSLKWFQDAEEKLNTLAKAGWEIDYLLPWHDDVVLAIMKRWR